MPYPDYSDISTPPFLPENDDPYGYLSAPPMQPRKLPSMQDDIQDVPRSQASERLRALVQQRQSDVTKPVSTTRKILGSLVSAYAPSIGQEILVPGSANYRKQVDLLNQQRKLEDEDIDRQYKLENTRSLIDSRVRSRQQDAQAEMDRRQNAIQGDMQKRAADNQNLLPYNRTDLTAAPLPPALSSPEPGIDSLPISSAPRPSPIDGATPPPMQPVAAGVESLPINSAPRPGPVAMSSPETPQGFERIPNAPYDPKNTARIRKTQAQLAKEKYEAETEPTPAPILAKFPDLPKRMKPASMEAYTRMIESGNTAEANRIAADAKAAEDRAARADLQKERLEAQAQQAALNRAAIQAAKGSKVDPAVEREYTAAYTDLNGQFKNAQAQSDAVKQAKGELSGKAPGQAIGAIKTISALAAGAGSGVRITQAELNSLLHARGIAGDFEGWVNKISGQGSFSKEQLAEMNSVLDDVARKSQEKQALYDTHLDKLANADSTKEIRSIMSNYRKIAMGTAPSTTGIVAPATAAPVKPGVAIDLGSFWKKQ